MSFHELFDARQGVHERASKIGKRSLPDDHKQCHSVAHDSVAFVGLVSDAVVVAQRDPTTIAYLLEPDLIGDIVGEVIRVTFYREAACSENFGELLPKIAIREIDRVQAARS
jgi:hypothetical protein